MNRRKRTALRVLGGFFAIMAACTVLSGTASSVLVARVEVLNPTGGALTNTCTGKGEVAASSETRIFLWADQQVETSVAAGTSVAKGETLVQFRMEYLKQKIDAKQAEVDQLDLQLKQQEISAAGTSYVPSADSAARSVEAARVQFDQASQRAGRAREAYDGWSGGNEAERQALYEALQAAVSEEASAGQALTEAQNAYADAAAQDAAQAANNASSAETAHLAAQQYQIQLDQARKDLDTLKAYQEAGGKICAEQDCVVLENNVADGTITSGAELIVTGSGGWKLKGALDEADSKKLAEGQKVSISMDAGGRSREVTIDSTRSGSDGSGDGNSVSGAGAGASASTDSSGDGGTKGGGFWYSSLPEGMSAGYGDTFTWKAQIPSARSYDYKIPLAALREDTAGNYCLIVSEAASAVAHMVWLRGYADYLSIAYPDASFTMESYDSFLESREAKVFSSVAVWDSQGEQAVSAEASGQSVRADIYMMGGHLQAVFGDTLFRGRYFTAGEEGVCLIDLRTAEELFGSRNVVGCSLVLGGEDYRITGLVDSGRKICVISPEEGALFHGVTVRKQTSEQSSDNAKAVLSAYFGGLSTQVTDGQLCCLIGLFRLALLLTTASVVPAVLLIKVSRRRLAGAAVLAAGVLALAVVVSGMPVGSDYLPTYRSDFDFFTHLWTEKSAQMEQLQSHQEFWHEERMLP